MAHRQIAAGETTAARLRLKATAVLKSDGISSAPGETGTPQISVDGGALTSAGIGALVEPGGSGNGGGEYYADLDAATVASGALGQSGVAVLETATARFVWDSWEVVANDTTTKLATQPSGARTIVVSVEDQSSNPVTGYQLDIYDASDATLLHRLYDSDNDGAITFDIDDGTYQLHITKQLFTADSIPETLVVIGNATPTYTGTVVTVPSATDPSQCLVYGYLREGEPALWDGRRINFWVTGDGIIDANVLGNKRAEVITGPDGTPSGDPAWPSGYFEIELPRLATVRCETADVGAQCTGLAVSATIPDQASATFDEVFRS
jgi:hypothetical protein